MLFDSCQCLGINPYPKAKLGMCNLAVTTWTLFWYEGAVVERLKNRLFRHCNTSSFKYPPSSIRNSDVWEVADVLFRPGLW